MRSAAHRDYELSVREARTGRQLGEATTAKASSTNCPIMMMFDSDTETVNGYASCLTPS